MKNRDLRPISRFIAKAISCVLSALLVDSSIVIMAGSTVNMCAIDLTKAFDKVNHHALFIKLMKRHIPVQVLEIIENLFSNCHSFVKWNIYVWS